MRSSNSNKRLSFNPENTMLQRAAAGLQLVGVSNQNHRGSAREGKRNLQAVAESTNSVGGVVEKWKSHIAVTKYANEDGEVIATMCNTSPREM